MSYALAYSVLTPITGGETGLQPRSATRGSSTMPANSVAPTCSAFGDARERRAQLGDWLSPSTPATMSPRGDADRQLLHRDPDLPLALRHDAARGQVEPAADELHRPQLRPYTLAAFVISGMYAGLAGGLMVAMDTQAGPERMFWTASARSC
jgi:hypothetical protein